MHSILPYRSLLMMLGEKTEGQLNLFSKERLAESAVEQDRNAKDDQMETNAIDVGCFFAQDSTMASASV